MNVSPTSSAHAPSNNPLFDHLAASLGSSSPGSSTTTPRPPITTRSTIIDRTIASSVVLSHLKTGKGRHTAPARLEKIDPLTSSVGDLILQMLDDDSKNTRRWPFHKVQH